MSRARRDSEATSSPAASVCGRGALSPAVPVCVIGRSAVSGWLVGYAWALMSSHASSQSEIVVMPSGASSSSGG